ncbi:MAG: hypothetical protein HY904_13700 [Deltaproteobacteria bacterium]|nr:hypothetical protein [Deltaproteobacteria bacterium]
MRIGLAADSGGDIAALTRAIRLLVDTLHCERVFFLGGNWADVDACQEATAEAAAPPPPPSTEGDLVSLMLGALAADAAAGQAHAAPRDDVVRVAEKGTGAPADEQKVMEMLGNTLCLLVHNKGDLNREDIANAHLILHGRSRKAAVVRIGPRAFVTPGSVTGDEPTVGVLDLQGPSITVAFHDLDGRERSREGLTVGGGTKFSVK